jgi:hypothetical protein
MEKHTFIVAGFDNLKTAVEPMSEEDEKSLLVLLIEELNNLFPVNLCTDIVCDRYLDSENDVFLDEPTDRTDLVLIGASHLARIARHLDTEAWKITDLTKPGWRLSAESVAELITALKDTGVVWDSATVILQLYDNSVYMVGGPGREKNCPAKTAEVPTISMVALWWRTNLR